MKIKKFVLWIILILWCGLIYFFSSQNATESSDVSSYLTEFLVGLIIRLKNMHIPVFNTLDTETLLPVLGLIEGILRKCAHFTVFLILGIISSALSCCYTKKKKHILLLSLLFCVFYAVTDELHQLFVAGRSGKITDVLIDSSGSLTGIILYLLLFRATIRKKHKDAET